MPEAPPLDLSAFLNPISPDNPVGEYLRWEEDYAALEAAREEDDDIRGDDVWKRPRKLADWEKVIKVGTDLLKTRSKDLQIAAWVAEALARRQGLAGLRDGLRLVLALQDAFWATAHPESGDMELREGVYEFLDGDKRLPLLVRGLPVTDVVGLPKYSLLKFKDSREVENILRKTPEREDELKNEGRIRAAEFDSLAEATERPYYVQLTERVVECQEAVRALNLSIKDKAHYGPQGPTLSQTAAALEELAGLVKDLLARKPAPDEPEADAEADADAEAETPGEPEPDQTGEDGGAGDGSAWAPTAAAAPARARPKAVAGSRGGPIGGPDDARARIVDAARYLREADPADPAPYLVVRALGMGELYRTPGPLDPSRLPAPASEDRQALRRLAAEADWSELLGQAERVLAGPEGVGWLDARRYAISALGGLGLAEAARAAEALLAAELRGFPEWPDSELVDGTPGANSETRAWLAQSFPAAPARAEAPAYVPDEPPPSRRADADGDGDGDGEAEPDPWDQARQYLDAGQPQLAIARIGRAVREARTGRDRFLRTLQQAEVCLMMGRPGVATPLLEGLARQVDDLKLDHWEDPTLCGRVVAALYRCIRGQDAGRARAVYERLCHLDIGQALNLGDEPTPPAP